MASIRPFRAWRYNESLKSSIESLTSPLFDVASPRQIANLRKNPINSIHLTLPAGTKPAKTAKNTLKTWKADGVIRQDEKPTIYVYYQYFSLHNGSKIHCRKGIIAMVKYPESSSATSSEILVHESTIKEAVLNRKELLEETLICTSPTHGLYDDIEMTLEPMMDESMKEPLYDVTDYQGVRDVISVISNEDDIRKVVSLIAKKKIALADGHHRYQAGLDLRDELSTGGALSNKAANYHLIYLTNSHADDFRILATHRLIHKMELTEEEFIDKAAEYFDIKEVDNPYNINDIILGKKWTFGILLYEKAYQFTLKEIADYYFDDSIHPAIRSLDVVIAHSIIVEKILNLPPPSSLTTEVSFDSNFSDCLIKVDRKDADMAIIINEISPEEVFKVGEEGAIMPQKTTFFYPKVVGGYIFGTIKDDEFDPSLYSSF